MEISLKYAGARATFIILNGKILTRKLLDKKNDCYMYCVFVSNGVTTKLTHTMLGHWGELLGTVHIEARTTTQARETPHSYPKP